MQGIRPMCALLLLSGVCLGQGWVVIPVDQYETLRGKAYPAAHNPEPPPVEATLSRVDYDLRIEGALATGRATLTVDVLKDGWVRVPMPAGLLVREARLGNERLALVPTPGKPGQQSAVISHKGRSVLLLDVAFPVVRAGGDQHLSLPVGASGITRATLTPPVKDVDLSIAGGYLPDKAAANWVAYARGNEPLVFSWHRRIVEPQRRTELPLRTRGSLQQLFGLGDDGTSLSAEVSIEVLQGVARRVRVAVPDGITINQVPGATVADWDVKGGELVVRFLEPLEGSTKFTISGDTKLPREGALQIPLLGLLDVERDSGGVAIEVLGAGEIKEAKAQGLELADASELGAMVAARQSPSMVAYRSRPGAAARSLDLQVARYTQQAVLTALIEEARYRVLMSTEGKTLVQARYAVRNNQRSFVRVALPQGAVVWSSSLAGHLVRPGRAPDGSLLFPLAKGRAGEDPPLFAIEIVYLVHENQWSSKGRSTLALPTMDLPVSLTGVVLFYPPLFHVTAAPGAFRSQAFERAASPVLNSETPPASPVNIVPASVSASTPAQALVDRYRARLDARPAAAVLPVRVAFPAVGPSLYLVSELTAEGKAPAIDLDYQKDKKGGVK